MWITPIERLKSWWVGFGSDYPRPDGWLQCASCREPVAESDGLWDGRDRVVLCNKDCADNWATDRSH